MMTKTDIEHNYAIEDGRIVSPGKFEGEPVFAPYFWDIYCSGSMSDYDDDGESIRIAVVDSDRTEFSELINAVAVYLNIDDNRAVYTAVIRSES